MTARFSQSSGTGAACSLNYAISGTQHPRLMFLAVDCKAWGHQSLDVQQVNIRNFADKQCANLKIKCIYI
jgi:hypothetical protein